MKEKNKEKTAVVLYLVYIAALIFSLNFRPFDKSGFFSSTLVPTPPIAVIIFMIALVFDIVLLAVLNVINFKNDLLRKNVFILILTMIIPCLSFIWDNDGNEFEIVKLIRIILTAAACVYFLFVIFNSAEFKISISPRIKTVYLVLLAIAVFFSGYIKERQYYFVHSFKYQHHNNTYTVMDLLLNDRIILACFMIIEKRKSLDKDIVMGCAVSGRNIEAVLLMRMMGFGSDEDLKKVRENIAGRKFADKLKKAIESGDINKVKELFDRGAKITDRDRNNNTPLYYALIYNKPEILSYLIEKGAGSDQIFYMEEALFYAVNENKPDLLKAVVEAGCDLNSYTEPPLLFAAKSGNTDMCRYMIDNGADVIVYGKYEETPLHRAAESGSVEIAGLLLDKGADINSRDINGETPIYYAVRENRKEMIFYLKDKKAKISIRNLKGQSPADTALYMDLSADVVDSLRK